MDKTLRRACECCQSVVRKGCVMSNRERDEGLEGVGGRDGLGVPSEVLPRDEDVVVFLMDIAGYEFDRDRFRGGEYCFCVRERDSGSRRRFSHIFSQRDLALRTATMLMFKWGYKRKFGTNGRDMVFWSEDDSVRMVRFKNRDADQMGVERYPHVVQTHFNHEVTLAQRYLFYLGFLKEEEIDGVVGPGMQRAIFEWETICRADFYLIGYERWGDVEYMDRYEKVIDEERVKEERKKKKKKKEGSEKSVCSPDTGGDVSPGIKLPG